jgi:hypothetical protein
MCLCFTSFIFWCGSTQVLAEEEKAIVETHILTDEELSRLYTCKQDHHNDTCITVSQEDAEMLMKIAVVEDFSSIESQASVMTTILNRVESPEFPNTIEQVIYQKDKNGRYQFSTVANGSFQKAVPDVNSHIALAAVEGRRFEDQIESDALFFESSSLKNTWQSNNLVYLSTVGGTRYYR